MIFDYKLWEEKAVAILASTIASIYATILVCVYVAFAFTELVTYPHFKVSFIMLLSVMFYTIKTFLFWRYDIHDNDTMHQVAELVSLGKTFMLL
jgi:hypothetical protein